MSPDPRLPLLPDDEALLRRVVRQTRRVRAVRLAVAAGPGVVAFIAGAACGKGGIAISGAAVCVLGVLWQRWKLGWFPNGPRSLFDGSHELTHMTFSGTAIYTTLRGRRIFLFGEAAASDAFRQALRRTWPQVPQLVSVWPCVPKDPS